MFPLNNFADIGFLILLMTAGRERLVGVWALWGRGKITISSVSLEGGVSLVRPSSFIRPDIVLRIGFGGGISSTR